VASKDQRARLAGPLRIWAGIAIAAAAAFGQTSIEIGAAGVERFDLPVEVPLDGLPSGNFHVEEVDGERRTLDKRVPMQLDESALIILLKGRTPSGSRRRFVVLPGSPAEQKPLVRLAGEREYEGQKSYRIETRNAVYLYHRQGAGFARLDDAGGRDWIGYRLEGGPDGKFRGIPNLVHPEGYFHPGGTGCTTRVAGAGPLRIGLHSDSDDGKWAVRWDIFPDTARLTVLRHSKPYWFLYEGTPAGNLEPEHQYMTLSDGRRIRATERWDADMPKPGWIYFGDEKYKRVLFLAQHEDDEAIGSYWPMQGQMTVFGFGRRKLEKFLDRSPARFTIGFADNAAQAPAAIAAATREVTISVRQ